jgi:hypothetical protein
MGNGFKMLQFNGICEVPNIINAAQCIYPPHPSDLPSIPLPLISAFDSPPVKSPNSPLPVCPPPFGPVWPRPAPSAPPYGTHRLVPSGPPPSGPVNPTVGLRQPPPSGPVSSPQLTTINSFRCLSPSAFLV